MSKPADFWTRLMGPLVLTVACAALPRPAQAQQPPAPERPVAPGQGETHAPAAQTRPAADSRHPLDPLSAEEIATAVTTVRQARQLAESVRFVTVTLNEPSKDVVVNFRAGTPVPREAFLALLDTATGTGYEAVVDLGARSVTRYRTAAAGGSAVDHVR